MSFGEYAQELIKTANYITQDGKGILASDESTGTYDDVTNVFEIFHILLQILLYLDEKSIEHYTYN